MGHDDLRESLGELRAEVDKLDNAEINQRARLDSLISEIERQLDADEDDHQSLIEATKSRIEQFEIEHPRITNILNDIMVTLSNLGI